jgi:threonine synthase
MKYISTNHNAKEHLFSEAIFQGLAPDGGLFFPERIPKLPDVFFREINTKKLHEIAIDVISPYIGNQIQKADLKPILEEAFDFDLPLVPIEDDCFVLELFHGPTLAFKDIGARVAARLISFFSLQKHTILVATSGDTGSAVANAFCGLPNIEVIILYPKGMVSNIQEKQFTTLGKNIVAIEIEGTFDHCQNLVKQAFMDSEIRSKRNIASANSISIARLIPQIVYYFYAYARLEKTGKPIVFSVPCGNFGNLTAGLFAKEMGLPVSHFIAATNRNNIVPEYLQTGKYNPRPSVQTISNAMDVGNPSNFDRIMELYANNCDKVKSQFSGFSISDEDTISTMLELYKKTGYTLDPHGAVAYAGLKEYMKTNEVTGIFLETAHPAKFKEIVEEALSCSIEVPEILAQALKKEKCTIEMNKEYNTFKDFLLSRK